MIADSSYFVALADSKDRWHEQALGLKVPRELLVTDLIVAESVTIVGDRGGRKIVSFDSDFDKVRGIRRIH